MSKEQTLKCYREKCINTAHPCGYNRVTHGMYCMDCAKEIHRHSRDQPGGTFFPLLQYKGDVRRNPGGSWKAGVIRVRSQKE